MRRRLYPKGRLEREQLISIHTNKGIMMTIVYGRLIDPEGMELVDEWRKGVCPECGKETDVHHFERCDGCINTYETMLCGQCGHQSGDDGTP